MEYGGRDGACFDMSSNKRIRIGMSSLNANVSQHKMKGKRDMETPVH